MISSYLEKGEYEKAADYIESMEELQSVKGEYVKTGNVAVDSILNYKLEVIESKQDVSRNFKLIFHVSL